MWLPWQDNPIEDAPAGVADKIEGMTVSIVEVVVLFVEEMDCFEEGLADMAGYN